MHLKKYAYEDIAMMGRRVGDEQATGHTCDPSEAIKRTGGDGRLYSQPLLEQLTWPRTAATITINFRLEILTQNYINDAMSFAAVDGDHIPVVFLHKQQPIRDLPLQLTSASHPTFNVCQRYKDTLIYNHQPY